MSTAVVDTKKVTGRRALHFNNLDEVLQEAERLAAARNIRTLGNWSPGQIFVHLANGIVSAIDGSPIKPNALIRFMGRYLLKGRILKKGMSPGFKLSDEARKAFYPSQPVAVAEGLDTLRKAVQRFKVEPKCGVSPFLGPMTDEQFVQLHCRHAELHLSFLVPE